MEIGDRIPSALDAAFLNYQQWCAKLGYPAADYSSWLRVERITSGISVAGVTQQTRRKAGPTPTQPAHSPTAPA